MTELGIEQFPAFVREVSGYDPFPWQRRLMGVVLESGWPSLLDLPTGTGKTHALLVALYALAVAPERSCRRIALVVDRRIIVDQVSAFGQRLEDALAEPAGPTCREVAARLRRLCVGGDGQPVRVVHLRGGIPRDDGWLGTPDQPTLIASTVDQVGSRLLFRGYGVSESMRPVHAGVLARDTLYLLDEVHLATAFEETLDRLERTYGDWPEQGGTGRRLQVVRMSATPRSSAEASRTPFGLDDEDRAHPVLSKRLGASRPATLAVVQTKRASDRAARASNRQRVAEFACARALDAIASGARAVGVVLNRVDTARRAARHLGARPELEVVLLTGRMRPYEKRSHQAALTRVAGAGVERLPDARPAVVVATSCIEAGADLDFDALVTEVASLDALRQRFGRLDRLGKYPKTQAWVLGRKDQLGSRAEDDPVYGAALRYTWDYLDEIAEDGRVDFGLSTFPTPEPERLRDLLPPSPEAPVLFPSYLDMWSETRPAPHPDPDVSLWLHGKGRPPERDVHVVFRADLPDPDPGDPRARALATEALEFLPPVADEAVAVPVGELRSWLGDRAAWQWTAEGVELVPASGLRPGDTVVLDARAGGLGSGTWDPDFTETVEDVAERACFGARGLAKLRLDRTCMPESLAGGLPEPPSTEEPERLAEARDECMAWLDGLVERLESAPEDWRPLIGALAWPEGDRRLVSASTSAGAEIWWVTVVPRNRAVEASTEDAISAFTGIPVSLHDHLEDVEAWAAAFTRTAGLAREVAEDVALAALLHDIGKADPRFQALLHGGDPIAAAGGTLLAKSRQFGRAAARRAEQRSGWPPGLRHELISLALLDASPPLQARSHDLELVRHLVASHHGWCRPWVPAMVDPTPTRVRVSVAGISVEVRTDALDDASALECASRFRRLCRRYGWHGLAYLEALLRLGDHRASATPGIRPGDAP